jgi:hypothetical protein
MQSHTQPHTRTHTAAHRRRIVSHDHTALLSQQGPSLRRVLRTRGGQGEGGEEKACGAEGGDGGGEGGGVSTSGEIIGNSTLEACDGEEEVEGDGEGVGEVSAGRWAGSWLTNTPEFCAMSERVSRMSVRRSQGVGTFVVLLYQQASTSELVSCLMH